MEQHRKHDAFFVVFHFFVFFCSACKLRAAAFGMRRLVLPFLIPGIVVYVLVLRMVMRVVLLLRIVFVHVYAEFSNASS